MNTNYGVYGMEDGIGTDLGLGPLTDSMIVESFNESWFDDSFQIGTNNDCGFMDSAHTNTNSIVTQNNNDESKYADLRHLQHEQQNIQQQPPRQRMISGHEQQQQQQQQQQRDDGYGSQTIFVTGVMEQAATDVDDDFDPIARERCHTWPSVQNETDDGRADMKIPQQTMAAYRRQRQQQRGAFSPSTLRSHGSSGLSLISESRESLSSTTGSSTLTSMNMSNGDGTKMGQWLVTPANLDDQQNAIAYPVVFGSPHSRHSSGSDMMEPVVKPVTMTNYKAGHPSYVELITQAINSSPEKRMTLSEIYDWMVANVPAFKDQRYLHSSSGWKNSVRHNLSLHSRFKRVKRNGMDKPSWWTVDLSEESKRERNNKRQSKQTRARANTTTAVMLHRPTFTSAIPYQPQAKVTRMESAVDGNALTIRHQSAVYGSQSNGTDIRRGSLPGNLILASHVSKTVAVAANDTVVAQEMGDKMEWSQFQNVKVENGQVYTTSKLDCLSQAITVTLCDASTDDGNSGKSKADIALTIAVSPESAVSPTCQSIVGNGGSGTMTNLVQAFRQNTLSDIPGRQLLRVQTGSGNVQEVSVPVPMPIRVVTRTSKSCQTDQATMTSPTLSNGYWTDGPLKQEHMTTLDDCLMALTGDLNSTTSGFGQAIPQQLQNSMGMQQESCTTVLASGYQQNDGQFMQNRSRQNTGSAIFSTSDTSIGAPLPDDLAAVDLRDSFDCNIMDILSFEMNCSSTNNAAEF